MNTSFVYCADRRTAKKRCPWAARITKVDGGFIAFATVDDYDTWRRQK